MDDQKTHERGICVYYYEGAYGPTIRIDIQTLDELKKIKSLFLDLAESKRLTVDLLDVPGVSATGVDHFTLGKIATTEEVEKSLERKESQVIGVGFIWSLSANGWRRCAGLIDGLIEYNHPSHQYLTQEGVD